MGNRITDFFSSHFFKGDKGVWMIYFFLCMISLVEIYSASSSLTYKDGHHWTPMISQAGFLFFGFIIILIVHRIPCKFYMLFPVILLPTSVILLAYTLIGAGTVNNAKRWMEFGHISFQPSELAKLALIMALAVILSKTQQEERVKTRHGSKTIVRATKGGYSKPFKICACLTCGICALIVTENFSTAAILFMVAVAMMFLGGIPKKLMAKGLAVVAVAGVVGVVTLKSIPDSTLSKLGGRVMTWKGRIEDKFGGGEKADSSKTIIMNDENWQVNNSYIAIANSNIIGLGTGNSIGRDYLSHAESDFIYSIIAEELGIFGGIAVIFLYVCLLIRVGRIAQKCDKYFPALLVMGLGIMLVFQALINMGVAVGLFPVTGQPLPLISRGGTSILMSSAYIGMILSVSRYAETVRAREESIAEVTESIETDEYSNGDGMQ